MANLSSDAYLRIWGKEYIEQIALDTSTAQTVYRGQPLIIDQNVDTVNATPYVDATVVAATDVFLGIAAAGTTAASGAAEASSLVEMYVEPTIVGFKSAVYTNADLGATVYMSVSGTLSSTAADNPQIGKLHRVEGGYAYVRLASPQVCTGA